MGLQRDLLGFHSDVLRRLGTGAEATAWLDPENRVIYKTFDLRSSGALGKKLSLHGDDPEEIRTVPADAVLADTLEKLMVLHEAGACPTEIVGLVDSGDCLIAKQNACKDWVDFETDLAEAVLQLRAIPAKGIKARGVWVFWAADKAWCLGDLHKGNIMRYPKGGATIIDALIGHLSTDMLRSLPALAHTVTRARIWRESDILPRDDIFHGVHDDEL